MTLVIFYTKSLEKSNKITSCLYDKDTTEVSISLRYKSTPKWSKNNERDRF